jgi:hypothetical protein
MISFHTLFHHIPLRSILTLPCPLLHLPSGYILSGFPTKQMCAFLTYPMRTPLFQHSNNIWWRVRASSFPQLLVISFLLGLNIILNNIFSNTFSVFLGVRRWS